MRLRHPDLEKVEDAVSDTTRAWRVPGYHGSIGFISSMSDHFCGSCSRLRIGAEGSVKVRPSPLASTCSGLILFRRCAYLDRLSSPSDLFYEPSLERPTMSSSSKSVRLWARRSSLTMG